MSKDKILLTTDKFKIGLINREITKAVEQLNQLIAISEKVCKITFDKEQRDAIRDKGLNFIREYFRPKWQFPDADEELNLRAIGIDLKPLIEFAGKKQPIWRNYPIEQNNKGVFELAGEAEQIKRCYVYAETERQIQAHKEAVKISTLINNAVDAGLIPKNQIVKMMRFGFLTVDGQQERATPNLAEIAKLK